MTKAERRHRVAVAVTAWRKMDVAARDELLKDLLCDSWVSQEAQDS